MKPSPTLRLLLIASRKWFIADAFIDCARTIRDAGNLSLAVDYAKSARWYARDSRRWARQWLAEISQPIANS